MGVVDLLPVTGDQTRLSVLTYNSRLEHFALNRFAG